MLKCVSLTLSRGHNIEKGRGGRNVKIGDWKTHAFNDHETGLFLGACQLLLSMIVDSISVHKHTKKGLGRNPANIISQLVNSPHNIPVIYFFLCPGLSVSAILEGQNYNQYLGKLLSFLDPVLQSPGRGRFVRCWHAKTDGSAASIFHSNCDGKGPTVTIIKFGNYIFGGYTDVSWHSSKYR